jgi:hypothetical protein
MKTTEVLKILQVVAWIIFIGLCIDAGAMLVTFLVRMFAGFTSFAYPGTDFSQLLAFSKWHYAIMASLIVILAGLKAYLFFQVVKIVSEVNIEFPFNEYNAGLISKMSSIALQIGITALLAKGYAQWLMKNDIQFTYEGGDAEYLLLAGILIVIAQIFKRGVELQSENELTI